jgi:uncharacterized delta-60 repeat protein
LSNEKETLTHMGSIFGAAPRLVVGLGLGAIALTGATAGSAQASALDASFGIQGLALTQLSAVYSDRFYQTVPAPGGGNYSVGYTSITNNDRAFVLAKTDAAGNLDPTFGSGGLAIQNVSPAPFPAAQNAPSGKAQAGPTGAGEIARGIVVQSNGKIVVTGQAETPATSGKPDSRDIDIYAARFNVNGSLDVTFGTNGVTRIDLSDGIRPVTDPAATSSSVTGDQSYGVSKRADDKLLLTTVQGLDTSDNATRTDVDVAVVQLTKNGLLDPTWGKNGVAQARTPGVADGPRQGVVDADGKFLTTSYGPPAGTTKNRPYLYRFNTDGSADTTFGTNGIATALVGGPNGLAEVYGAVPQGDKYVLTGYGSRNETPTNTDALVYRFNHDGTWDQSFGRDGLVTYDGPSGGADRARNITKLADGRFVAVGGTETGPGRVDGLIFVVKADGTADTSVGTAGGLVADLGGPNDFFYGVSAQGGKLVAAGYLGAANATNDDAALVRVDLTPTEYPTNQPEERPQDQPVPAAPAAPAPAAPAATPISAPVVTTIPANQTAGTVSVTCERIGKAKSKIRCVVKQSNVASGTVKIKLVRKGAKTLTGSAKASRGKATITINASRKKASYSVELVLPTPSGKTQAVTKTVSLK